VFKDGFRDHGIEGPVAEWQKVPICDNIDFRRYFDFKIDDVWGAAAVPCTEIQDFRVGTESLESFFDTSIPSWGGIRASDEVR
jgi:hypothetical protein